MKIINRIIFLATLMLMPLSMHGIDVTITTQGGSFGTPLLNAPTGSTQIMSDTLGVLLVDTLGDGIALDAAMISDESFWGGTDNYIAGITGSSNLFGPGSDVVVSFSAQSANNAVLSTGQSFYIAWFPGLISSVTTIGLGQAYGLTRDSSWVLPTDGGTFAGNPAGAGGNALFTVGAIPEPSTYALILSIVLFAFILVRKNLRYKSINEK